MAKATVMGKVIRLRDSFGEVLKRNSLTKEDVLKMIEDVVAKCEYALSLIEEDSDGFAVPLRAQQAAASVETQAFQRFMASLEQTLQEAGARVRVTSNVSWIKIEGVRNGHRIYVSKGKLAVGRIDSTLPPEAVPGAATPGRRNGRIASWLPTSPEAVKRAIEVIASDGKVRPLK